MQQLKSSTLVGLSLALADAILSSMPKLDADYVREHAEEVAKYVRELEEMVKAQKEDITAIIQLGQGARQWWQKMGL